MAERIRVSVVYADPLRQIAREIDVVADATVNDAIQASGILRECPADFRPASVGIFGRRVVPEAGLRDGDRIELYRPLLIDPKEARRRRAKRC
jgi:putative ubiquitin-RnfH superfamily antitoxin RatB of RatAB toxin-antitoxin module